MKIRSAAVTFQNRIQYDSFINAIDIMIERGIKVDIYIPIEKYDKGFSRMFEEFYEMIDKKKYNIYREMTDYEYDILFIPYPIWEFSKLKRKYTIKYMYGLTTKPKFSLSPRINNIFDGFLCYGNQDAECLSNYGICFQIGNIKYLNTKISKRNELKKTILYLPTYGKESSIDNLIKYLKKLKDQYEIIIKPHHCTEYLENKLEKTRMKNLKNNFENIYSSKAKLEDLIDKCDLIISDMSGAIFDGICLKKPVIIYYNEEDENYGDYVSLPVQIAKNNFILSINNNNLKELEQKIKIGLTKEQIKTQNQAYKKLFCCEINETKEKFMDFLNAMEDDIIKENYYLIHQNVKKEFADLYSANETLNISNEELKKSKSILEETIKKLENQNQDLENQIYNLHHSTSWKITKPIRFLKDIVNKILNK